MNDPYEVLGVERDASLREVSAAWRRLVKEWHPDLRGDANALGRMVQVNAAYEQILAERTGRATPAASAQEPGAPEQAAQARPRRRGWWLDPHLRHALGLELLGSLHEHEPVEHVVGCDVGGSAALLVVTDRRLLWLLDDNVLGRVRSIPFAVITGAERPPSRPWRRSAALRISRGRSRFTFSGLDEAMADRLLRRSRRPGPPSRSAEVASARHHLRGTERACPTPRSTASGSTTRTPATGDTAIVFSHGYLMDHSMFDAQVEALRDGYRVITWDERGHGDTETSEDPFSYWDSASDVIGLLDALDIDQAVLAGMSQGGFLSMRAALTAPDRVKALVLIDTQAGIEDPREARGLRPAHRGVGRPRRAAAGGARHRHRHHHRPGLRGHPRRGTTNGATSARSRCARSTRRSRPATRSGTASRRSAIRRSSCTGPTTRRSSSRSGSGLADGIPNSEIVVIDGAGHAANMTHADDTNPHIRRFLDGLE